MAARKLVWRSGYALALPTEGRQGKGINELIADLGKSIFSGFHSVSEGSPKLTILRATKARDVWIGGQDATIYCRAKVALFVEG
jgi:hypothetical protein